MVRHLPELVNDNEHKAQVPDHMEEGADDLVASLEQLVIGHPEPHDANTVQQYCRTTLLSTCPLLAEYPNLLALGISKFQMKVQTAQVSLVHERVEIANELLERIRTQQALANRIRLVNDDHDHVAGPIAPRRSGRIAVGVPNLPEEGGAPEGLRVNLLPASLRHIAPWTVVSTREACREMEERLAPPAPNAIFCCVGTIERARKYHHYDCYALYTTQDKATFKNSVSLHPATVLQLRGLEPCRNCRRHFP